MCISFCRIFDNVRIKFKQNWLTVIGGVSDLESDEIVRLCKSVRTNLKFNAVRFNFVCSSSWVVVFLIEEDNWGSLNACVDFEVDSEIRITTVEV